MIASTGMVSMDACIDGWIEDSGAGGWEKIGSRISVFIFSMVVCGRGSTEKSAVVIGTAGGRVVEKRSGMGVYFAKCEGMGNSPEGMGRSGSSGRSSGRCSQRKVTGSV